MNLLNKCNELVQGTNLLVITHSQILNAYKYNSHELGSVSNIYTWCKILLLKANLVPQILLPLEHKKKKTNVKIHNID